MIPCAPADFNFGINVRTVPSSMTISTARQLSLLKEETVGFLSDVSRLKSFFKFFSSTFIFKPTILLADEIVSELDHVTAREIMNLIADAQKTMNLTAIMVHHDMQLALEYADRVAVIKDGEKILEIGVEGDTIVDFQTGDLGTEEIMEMYADDSKK